MRRMLILMVLAGVLTGVGGSVGAQVDGMQGGGTDPVAEWAVLAPTLAGERLAAHDLQIIREFARLSDMSSDKALSDLDRWAREEGVPKDDVLKVVSSQMVGLSRPNVRLAVPAGKINNDGSPLPPGAYPGDMLRTDASIDIWLAKVSFGHVGLYNTRKEVIEAGRCGPDEHRIGVYRVSVDKNCWTDTGVVRAFVSGRRGHGRSLLINGTALGRARKWADERRPYNINFLDNKHNRGTGKNGAFNCSQLVWSAYLPYVDLDNDPGNALINPRDGCVMPDELMKHRQVNPYH